MNLFPKETAEVREHLMDIKKLLFILVSHSFQHPPTAEKVRQSLYRPPQETRPSKCGEEVT